MTTNAHNAIVERFGLFRRARLQLRLLELVPEVDRNGRKHWARIIAAASGRRPTTADHLPILHAHTQQQLQQLPAATRRGIQHLLIEEHYLLWVPSVSSFFFDFVRYQTETDACVNCAHTNQYDIPVAFATPQGYRQLVPSGPQGQLQAAPLPGDMFRPLLGLLAHTVDVSLLSVVMAFN